MANLEMLAAYYADGIRTEVHLDRIALNRQIAWVARRAIRKARTQQRLAKATAAHGILVLLSHPAVGVGDGNG